MFSQKFLRISSRIQYLLLQDGQTIIENRTIPHWLRAYTNQSSLFILKIEDYRECRAFVPYSNPNNAMTC